MFGGLFEVEVALCIDEVSNFLLVSLLTRVEGSCHSVCIILRNKLELGTGDGIVMGQYGEDVLGVVILLFYLGNLLIR